VGTQDQVAINNWLLGGEYRVGTIQAGLHEIQASQLEEMRLYLSQLGAPAGVGGQWTENQIEEMTPILASYWQPI
jgi:hypothetical protein